jgi:hypothetical protein
VESSTLVQQGIAAYKEGNKEEAVRLLSQALRENRQDEEAWLYLGAALDDPGRKRQAFQQVLQINPANEKARNALARLEQMEGAPAGSARGASTSSAPRTPPEKRKMSQMAEEGFVIPVEIEGAPPRLTLPYIMENGRRRIDQAVKIYMNRDYEQIVQGAVGATMWDVVFIAGLGVVAMGAAELIGGLIGWPLSLFRGGIGGLFWPIISAIATMIGAASGVAVGMYGSRMYLQNQGVSVSQTQHGMYYVLVLLPLLLVSAAFTFITNALGFLNCLVFPLLALASLALAIYGFILLKEAFDRVYGSAENRGLITAAIAIGGWIVGGIVTAIVRGLFSTIFGAIFRYRF